jgi:cytochrome c553
MCRDFGPGNPRQRLPGLFALVLAALRALSPSWLISPLYEEMGGEVKRIPVWASYVIGVMLLVLGGCGEQEQSSAPEPVPQATAPAERDQPTEVEMVASMEAHYNIVILAHDALLQGDLDRFRSQLALVPEQELPANSPAAWTPLHERLQAAARSGAEVADLDAAAAALASVVLACGTCHAALDTGPVYPAPAPDDGADPLKTAMRDHQWVTERLWEGVTGPWDNAWERGAEALAVVQVFGEAQQRGVNLSDDLRRREQELREIGTEAKATTALDARAALYGRLLATCGECHRAVGVKFEPVR